MPDPILPQTPTPDNDSAQQTPPSLADAIESSRKHFATRGTVATLNEISTRITRDYLAAIDPDDPPPPSVLEAQLLGAINAVRRIENAKTKGTGDKLSLARTLSNWEIAQVLLHLHHPKLVAPIAQNTDREYDLLVMYVTDGPRKGTYTGSEDAMRTTARSYNTQLSLNDFKEIVAILREDSPRVHKCTHRDLIAAGNGIVYYGQTPLEITIGGVDFRFEPKRVHPFHPALVFMTKARVDYVEGAPVHVIRHPGREDWELVDWMSKLSDDEGVPELLWEILGAVVRPHVRWNKTAWFYSERGINGKGTLCALARNLVGDGAHTSIPLADFGKNFALEPLISSNAIIVDENDVGTFIDQAANLKAIVTGDVIQIDRKYRMPVAFQFSGFMIQCLNDLPRAKDKSDSYYRRQLFVPFKKWFGGGDEKRYIKEDYLKRKEVLEYALWYVINMAGSTSPGDYYELSEPPATKEVLAEYKETNDPVRAFWLEFRERMIWDLLPFTFLYDLYKAWFADVSPSGSPVSSRQFSNELVAITREDDLWHCSDKRKQLRTGTRMDDPEPLIAEYDLKKWMDPKYTGSDPYKKSRPIVGINYRGLERRTSSTSNHHAGNDRTAEEDAA